MDVLDEDQEWIAQCRWQLQRSMSERIASAFQGRHYLEKENRVFENMEDYRAWCAQNYPAFLGYDWESYKSAQS